MTSVIKSEISTDMTENQPKYVHNIHLSCMKRYVSDYVCLRS